MHSKQHALDYIKNNNGVVKKKCFLEDFEPIGEKLLSELIADGRVETSTCKDVTIIFFSDDGA